MVSLKKMTAFFFFFEVYFKQFSFFLMSLIHVCSCVLCSFNGEVFKYREEKEKLALFSSFFASLFVTSNSYLTDHLQIMGCLQCSAFRRWCLFFFFFFNLFINEVLPRDSICPNHPSFWGLGFPVFSFTNGRGLAALKLFDQVSCRETMCINWHIGATTVAPLVNNYWSFKLLLQLSPS